MGHGLTLDNLEECTIISAEVLQSYFHSFIAVGANILYPLYVVPPATVDECRTHAHEFQQAGFSGCIGSTDAMHIAMKRCMYRLRNNHLGPKQHLTTRTFNLTVNHHWRILSTTVGYPGRWNDKTDVLFDPFVRGLNEGSVVPDLSFELFECDEFGNTSTTEYRGPWLIVDNGYLQWSKQLFHP